MGNVQSHLQTSHHARPYSVELGSVIDKTWIARAGADRVSEGGARERGGGFYEERKREIRREIKSQKGTGEKKIERSHGIMHKPKKKKRKIEKTRTTIPVVSGCAR